MFQDLDTDQKNRLWEYAKHEEEMFNQKLNFSRLRVRPPRRG